MCNTVGDRVKELRNYLNLNQTEFGNRINKKQTTIAGYENNSKTILERTIKDICREYSISYNWLVDGEGEMFVKSEKSSLNLLGKEYDLNEIDKIVILKYLELSKNDRKSINNFILGIRDK